MNELIALLQTAADSTLGGEIGRDVGLFVGSWAIVALGIANKYVTAGALKLLEALNTKVSGAIKSGIAAVFAAALVWASQTFNIPFVSTDIEQLPFILTSVLTWGLSMGYHDFVKALLEKFLPKPTA